MKIYSMNYNWNGALEERKSTDCIILHHRAGDGDAASIHAAHLKNGWTGIGYHFYIRKNGGIYKGRPISAVGAHCTGHNKNSLGICFEGNFEKEKMTARQIAAGRELVAYLKNVYPGAEIKQHKDFQATACPGKSFPFEEIRKGEKQMTVEDAIEIIQAKAGIEDETIEFLLCYKYGEELLRKLAETIR